MATDTSFELVGIQVFPGCNKEIHKVLRPSTDEDSGWFLFTERYKVEKDTLVRNKAYRLPSNFFSGDGKVSVSAIVGKNGSGKSTVVEILLAILNNAGVWLSKLVSDKEGPTYLNGLHATVYYEMDGELRYVGCKGDRCFMTHLSEQDCFRCDLPNPDQTKEAKEELKRYLSRLFFAVVNNYSLHAFNVISKTSSNYWMHGLLHKNDGYLLPITVNPYRKFGVFDMINEVHLVSARLASLLYLFKGSKEPLIDGYQLNQLSFTPNSERVERKYLLSDKKYGLKEETVLHIEIGEAKSDRFHTILRAYFPDLHKSKSGYIVPEQELAYKYLVAKTLSVSREYPEYADCIKIDITALVHSGGAVDAEHIKGLVDRIKKRKTHVEAKIHQVLRYVEWLDKQTAHGLSTEITQAYIDEGLKGKGLSLQTIEQAFPPSFFDIEITLTPSDNEKEKINFQEMSSGERQYLFFVSTLLYHLKNLDSVAEGERTVHYSNVLCVLEEVELYFHPEYQRTLVAKLLKSINACGFDNLKHIHLLLVSHSPFVLSDIPPANVLFVDNGQQLKEREGLCAFGSNIHEMLSHSFFLNQLMGQFAQEKIQGWIKLLYEDAGKIPCCKTLRYELEQIGEDLIREQLLERLDMIERGAIDKEYSLQCENERLKQENENLKNRVNEYAQS